MFNRLRTDWKRLVDEAKIREDRRYLHHDAKPVLLVWGFYRVVYLGVGWSNDR